MNTTTADGLDGFSGLRSRPKNVLFFEHERCCPITRYGHPTGCLVSPQVDSSIEAAISRKVRRAKPGTVFTPALFAGLGGGAAVDKALQRLVARDELRRLSRGLYHKPRHDLLLGILWPSVDVVVAALTGKDRLSL